MDSHKLKQQVGELFSLYAKSIIRFAYLKTSDYELAQDISEDTFIRFWRVLAGNKPVGNPKALLYFIANGLVIDEYRRKGLRKHVSLDVIDERILAENDNTENVMDTQTEMNRIYVKLNEIKKEYRDVIVLYYVEEMKVEEIAYILEKSQDSVRVLIHRALRSLKEKL